MVQRSKILNFVEYKSDPIWKQIPITEIEKKIIETDVFSRLINIRQMSLAYIAFSGANHTRYEHSLGAMHVTYSIATQIENLPAAIGFESLKEESNLTIYEIYQFLRLAALLHDLGHPPFSHAIEWVFQKYPDLFPKKEPYKHDNYTCELIKKNQDLLDILKNQKLYNPTNLANFISPNKNDKTDLPSALKILQPIISGDFDADKVDYIIRDNYHCGIPINIEIHNIVNSLKLTYDKKRKEIMLKLKPDKIHVLENLLLLRNQLINVIHHNKESRIANFMLMNATKDLFQNLMSTDKRAYSRIIKDMHEKWTDFDLYKRIDEQYNENLKFRTKNLLFRALKGNLLSECLKITLKDIDPLNRASLYFLFRNSKSIIDIQENVSSKYKIPIYCDLAYKSPPPLTLELDLVEQEAFTYLNTVSNITKGMMKDSFFNSFISIYCDKLPLQFNEKKITNDLLNEIRLENIKIRENMLSNNRMPKIDLVLLILKSIKIIEDFYNEDTKLWSIAITNLQEHTKNITEIIELDLGVKSFEKELLDQDYSVEFQLEVENLVFSGLLDQRIKQFSREKYSQYPFRIDHCINNFGVKYIEFLYENLTETTRQKYISIEDYLKSKIQSNKEIILEFIDFYSNEENWSKSRKIKEKMRSKNLCLVSR